jgi:hypothetical protein
MPANSALMKILDLKPDDAHVFTQPFRVAAKTLVICAYCARNRLDPLQSCPSCGATQTKDMKLAPHPMPEPLTTTERR